MVAPDAISVPRIWKDLLQAVEKDVKVLHSLLRPLDEADAAGPAHELLEARFLRRVMVYDPPHTHEHLAG